MTPKMTARSITLYKERDFGKAEVYLEFGYQTPDGDTFTKTSPIHKMREGETIAMDWECAPPVDAPWISWWVRIMEHDPQINITGLRELFKQSLGPIISAYAKSGTFTTVLKLGSGLLEAALEQFSEDDFLAAGGGFLRADQEPESFSLPTDDQRATVVFRLDSSEPSNG